MIFIELGIAIVCIVGETRSSSFIYIRFENEFCGDSLLNVGNFYAILTVYSLNIFTITEKKKNSQLRPADIYFFLIWTLF